AAVVRGVREVIELALVHADADVERPDAGGRVTEEERRLGDRGHRRLGGRRTAAIVHGAGRHHAAHQPERVPVLIGVLVAAGALVHVERAGGAGQGPREPALGPQLLQALAAGLGAGAAHARRERAALVSERTLLAGLVVDRVLDRVLERA